MFQNEPNLLVVFLKNKLFQGQYFNVVSVPMDKHLPLGQLIKYELQSHTIYTSTLLRKVYFWQTPIQGYETNSLC